MSIVSPLLADARVLDLFAGCGALGLEAASRGAASVDLVENAPRSLAAIAKNIETLGAGSEVTLHRADALRFIETLKPHAYDVAFADPPYDLGLAAEVARCWLATPFAGMIGIEHRAFEEMPTGGEKRRYGGTAITFYRSE